jgi:hypothetical protein
MLTNGAFSHTDAVACQQNGADLCGGACRQFETQLAGFLQQLVVATGEAKVGTWFRLQPRQPLLAIGPQPAIERAARKLVKPTVR